MSNLRKQYETEAKDELKKEFNYKNVMAIPRIEKVIVNMGTGEALRDKGLAEKITNELAAITGQKPAVRSAKLSIAGFGIRAGMPVGLKVTLRGQRMYDFLERLISVTLPRLRDFRGVSLNSFDEHGNYTLGIKEHTVFPEVDLGNVDRPRGMEVTIVTNTKDKEAARKLLELLGMPFEKEE